MLTPRSKPTRPGRKWNSPLDGRAAYFAYKASLFQKLAAGKLTMTPSIMNDWIDSILFSGSMTGSSCPACGPMWVCALSTTTSSGYGAPGSWRTGSRTTSRPWSPPTTSSRHSSVSGYGTKPQGFGWQVQNTDSHVSHVTKTKPSIKLNPELDN